MSIGETLLRSRYQPLKRVLSYDVFNTGFNGWTTLMPSSTEYPGFDVPKTLVNKDRQPPVMLSSATFRYPGTHGAMSDTYFLKLSARPVAVPCAEIPAKGCLGHAIKRLSFSCPGCRYLQIGCWLIYTAEQDVVDGSDRPQPGLHEGSIRDFGMGSGVQKGGKRYHVGIRYLNAVNGKLVQKQQYERSNEDMTDHDWTYRLDGDWCKRGVDP